MSDQAQPQGQDPAQTAPPATPPAVEPTPTPAAVQPAPTPQPAPEPSQGSSPWANDLNQAFPDEAQRTAVDQFLRGNVQPYVTKLEQESRDATEFLKEFQDTPRETYIDVTEQLFGEDVAKSVGDYLDLIEENPNTAQPPPPEAQRDPEVQAVIDAYKANQEKADYDSEFARVAEANPDLGLDPANDLLRPFVAELGDFDQAAQAYRNYVAAIRSGYEPAPPAPPQEQPAPPATLGTEGAGSTPPPTQVEHQSVNDAIDSWVDEQRAQGQSIIPDESERAPAPPPPVAA